MIYNDIRHIKNANLKNFCTFKIGGRAKVIYFPENQTQLKRLIDFLNKNKEEFFVLGNGSNLLFLNTKNISFIKLNKLNKIKVCSNNIYAGSGASLNTLCHKAKNESLSGLEGISGIPATVGGAVYMNACAFGNSISENLIKVKILDENLKIKTLLKKDCDFSYKNSIFMKRKFIILEAVFSLYKSNKQEIENKMKQITLERLSKQPQGYSAGCSFKNTEKGAGRLIDDCGLKGLKVGGAVVSNKHANFIINKKNAKACHVLKLVEKIKISVYNKHKVNLEEEFIKVGK